MEFLELLLESFEKQSSFSLLFMNDLRNVEKFYNDWKLIHEVVKDHPDVFDNLDRLSEKEKSKRFEYFEKKREEMKIKHLRDQMELMLKYLAVMDEWMSTRENTVFDLNITLGSKLDFVRRVCKLYKHDGKINKDNTYRAIQYTNDLLQELSNEREKEKSKTQGQKEKMETETTHGEKDKDQITIEDVKD